MERFLGKRKKENVIIGAISFALIIILLVSVGTNTMEYWLTSPLVWEEPHYIEVTLINKEENQYNMNLEFVVQNNSFDEVDSYRIDVLFGNQVVTLSSMDGIAPNSYVVDGYDFSADATLKRLYTKLYEKNIEDINYKFHVRELKINREIVVENNGTIKIIGILLISIISSILVFKEIVKPTWLRILCKFLMVPGILTLGIILLVVIIVGNGKGVPAGTANKNKTAAENYKREANLKAGALAHGNTREAAFAQARMDKNFVDMLPTNASLSVKNEYKRQAQLKAGALAHGNEKEAAKCQATMDRLMAEIMNNQNN